MDKSVYLKVRSKLNFKPSIRMALIQIALNGSLLTVALWLHTLNLISTYVISQIVFAVHLYHSYTILHETVHLSFVRSRMANILIGHIFAAFSFLPFFARQKEHLEHHKWTGTFNEASTKRALKTFNMTKIRIRTLMAFCFKYWIPIFSINEHFQIWKIALQDLFKKATANKTQLIFSQVHFLLSCSLAFTLFQLLVGPVVTLIPALVLYFILIEYFNLPHHLDSPIIESSTPLPVYAQELSTKSCAPIPALGRWLTLDFNFHVAHHHFPNLPWHELHVAEKLTVNFGSKEESQHSEWSWHHRLRNEPFNKAFKKYIEQQEKIKNERLDFGDIQVR